MTIKEKLKNKTLNKLILNNENSLIENNESIREYINERRADIRGKWVCAKDLKVGDRVLLSDGKYGIIEKIEIEKLEIPETTYNFEVEDFHTYYVGKSGILVHNRCKLGKNMKKAGLELKATEDAHHLYPQKFRSEFKKIGIDVDDAINGIAMDSTVHRAGAQVYNKLWAQVINEVTEETAEIYMKQFMKEAYKIIL